MAETDAIERLTLTIPEAARVLGIGRSLAYQAARSGELPTIRIGRRIVVLRESLAAMSGSPHTPSDQS